MMVNIDGEKKKFKVKEISSALDRAAENERNTYEISASGYGIHWPLIDEDIAIDGLLGIIHKRERVHSIFNCINIRNYFCKAYAVAEELSTKSVLSNWNIIIIFAAPKGKTKKGNSLKWDVSLFFSKHLQRKYERRKTFDNM